MWNEEWEVAGLVVDEVSGSHRRSRLVNMNECCLHVVSLPRSLPHSLSSPMQNPYELTRILFIITRYICCCSGILFSSALLWDCIF